MKEKTFHRYGSTGEPGRRHDVGVAAKLTPAATTLTSPSGLDGVGIPDIYPNLEF